MLGEAESHSPFPIWQLSKTGPLLMGLEDVDAQYLSGVAGGKRRQFAQFVQKLVRSLGTNSENGPPFLFVDRKTGQAVATVFVNEGVPKLLI